MLPAMAARPAVTPNRRGMRSRELVLDAAERVMAEDGFEAATLARVVEESGIPMSSVYHYFGSKEGILSAVMERGAERFFAALPDPDQRAGSPEEHLAGVVTAVADALERHPSFLRLLVVFAIQPPQTEADVDAVVDRVREMALVRLRRQLAIAYDDDPRARATDRLARFALAVFDGAFVASRADAGARLADILAPLPAAVTAVREAITESA
jgi:AcrR family transcriptional regulator